MPVCKRIFFRLRSAPLLAGMVFLSALISFSLPLNAQENKPAAPPCIENLKNPSLKNVDCTLDFYLDKRTQKSMRGSTAGMIRNAACKTKLSLVKKKIFTALLNEQVLEVSKQPVSCNIHTMGEPLLTRFNLAPKIRFAGGKAVEAKPGMSDVLGLPEILAELLVEWVNTSQVIESAMLDEVNKSLKMMRPPEVENKKMN